VPLLVPAFVRRMVELTAGFDIAVVEIDGRLQPLSAVYRRDRVLPEADQLLAADRRRPIFLFETLRTRRVLPAEMMQVDPQLLTLQNLNTPEDYKKALAVAGLSEHSDCGR